MQSAVQQNLSENTLSLETYFISNFPDHEAMSGKIKEKVMELVKNAKKMGEDDPRRIFHSVKVGLALTLVSLFYYFRPLYHGFGQAGMWAILTVVVVFEFSVGGTISKGVNRGAATLLAGGLGVGTEYLANECGKKGEPIVIGLFVFILAAVSTYTRFIPKVKRKYDYGVMVFILTFSLVAVSGARASEIWEMAHQRLTTILIGGATCMIVSLCIRPVWAGKDLHNLIAANIEKLAAFLEGFGGNFCVSSDDVDQDKSYLESHKSVINSKATEEILANFAWWELGHGGFKLNHPWKLYLNVGGIVRQCACQIETLSGCLNTSKPKVTSEFEQKIQPACVEMSIESSKALREIAAGIKEMRFPPSAVEIHLGKAKTAAEEVKDIMGNSSLVTKADLQQLVPILVIASVLIDIIKFVQKIWTAVNQLSGKAGFKQVKSTAKVTHVDDEVAIDVVEIKTNLSEMKN